MTTIAFANNVLASDSSFLDGDQIICKQTKIYKTHGGVYWGLGGSCMEFEFLRMVEHIKRPSDMPDMNDICVAAPDMTGLGVFPDGTLWYLCVQRKEGSTEFFPIHEKIAAIGTGSPYAYAALRLGKTAIESVELACTLDRNSCLPIHSVRTDNATRRSLGRGNSKRKATRRAGA